MSPWIAPRHSWIALGKMAFCCASAVFRLSIIVGAEARKPGKLPRIGWLGARPFSSGSGRELFVREIRVLGYVEGQNIGFEYRSAENRLESLPALADELVRLKVNVLFVPAGDEARAAKKATSTIPIVFAGVADPIEAGLVESLARP